MVKFLQRGGMGAVYEARHEKNALRFAVKVLETNEPEWRKMFANEMKILAKLQHAHIVGLTHEGSLPDGKPYFIMSLLTGPTLKERIEKSGALQHVEFARYLRDIGSALEYAHGKGVIHRDIKPANIQFDDSGSVQIIDFGISSVERSDGAPTTLKGTTEYMAPELSAGATPSRATDLFSLAVTCYEALTRHQPFRAKNDGALHIPPPAHTLNPAVPRQLSKVLHKGMAKEPGARSNAYPTTLDFAEKFERASRGEDLPEFGADRLAVRIEEVERFCKSEDWDQAHIALQKMERAGETSDRLVELRREIDPKLADKRLREDIATLKTELQTDPDAAWETWQAATKGVGEKHPERANLDELGKEVKKARLKKRTDRAASSLSKGTFREARESLAEARGIDRRDTQVGSLLGRLRREESRESMRTDGLRLLREAASSAEREGHFAGAQKILERGGDLIEGGFNQIGLGRYATPADLEFRAYYDTICSKRGEANKETRSLIQTLSSNERQIDANIESTKTVFLEFTERKGADDRIDFLRTQRSLIGTTPLGDFLSNAEAQKDLFESLINKGQVAAKAAQYHDAIQFLELAAEIRPSDGDLRDRVAELRRLEQAATQESKRHGFAEEMGRLIQLGEYLSAIQAYRKAAPDHQSDPEISAKNREAVECRERSRQARERLVKAHSLRRDQRDVEAIPMLEEAYALDPNDVEISQFLGLALLEQSEHLVDKLGKVEEGRELYERARNLVGDDPASPVFRQQRPAEIDAGESPTFPTVPQPSEPLEPPDNSVSSIWEAWQHKLKKPWDVTDGWIRAGRERLVAWIKQMPSLGITSKMSGRLLAGIAIPLIATVATWWLWRERPAVQIEALIRTNPSGARVRIENGETKLSPASFLLIPGHYLAEITLSGYESSKTHVPVVVNMAPLDIALTPLPLNIHFVTDSEGTTVIVDDGENGVVTDGRYSKQGVSPGRHRVVVNRPGQEATEVDLDYTPGRSAEVTLPPTTRSFSALAVSSFNGVARIRCGSASVAMTIHGLSQDMDCATGEIRLNPGDHPSAITFQGAKNFVLRTGTTADITIAMFWKTQDVAPQPRRDDFESQLKSVQRHVARGRFSQAKRDALRLKEVRPDDPRLGILLNRIDLECQLTECRE